MSKPGSRGSLIGLKSMLPKVAPVPLTLEMEERILGKEVDTSVCKDISIDVPAPAPPPDPEPPPPSPRRKELTVLMNAKLPVRLHARLKRTAQFNDISMTDILVRAIEAELASGRYVAPPDTWGSDPI